MKNNLLTLIRDGEPLTTEQMGQILGLSHQDVAAQLDQLRQDGILLGWRPVLNPDLDEEEVRAVIEVRIAPEREGGFDRIAERIAKFDRVESCYLMSGAYDLMVVLRAQNLKRIAQFVFEKLATIAGVQSTATHFMLRAYKESGFILPKPESAEGKLSVSP